MVAWAAWCHTWVVWEFSFHVSNMLNGSASPLVGCLLGLGSSLSHATVRMFTKSTGLLGGERRTWIHGEAHGVLLC